MENSYREALSTLELYCARQREIMELSAEQRELNRDEQIRYFARKNSEEKERENKQQLD